MRRRLALATALMKQPRLLLLDEPFGMPDSLTRTELQDVLLEVWRRDRITAIMVTHDRGEAVTLADRIVVMDGYRVTGELPNTGEYDSVSRAVMDRIHEMGEVG